MLTPSHGMMGSRAGRDQPREISIAYLLLEDAGEGEVRLLLAEAGERPPPLRPRRGGGGRGAVVSCGCERRDVGASVLVVVGAGLVGGGAADPLGGAVHRGAHGGIREGRGPVGVGGVRRLTL
jgi:hypothetical protein